MSSLKIKGWILDFDESSAMLDRLFSVIKNTLKHINRLIIWRFENNQTEFSLKKQLDLSGRWINMHNLSETSQKSRILSVTSPHETSCITSDRSGHSIVDIPSNSTKSRLIQFKLSIQWGRYYCTTTILNWWCTHVGMLTGTYVIMTVQTKLAVKWVLRIYSC